MECNFAKDIYNLSNLCSKIKVIFHFLFDSQIKLTSINKYITYHDLLRNVQNRKLNQSIYSFTFVPYLMGHNHLTKQ